MSLHRVHLRLEAVNVVIIQGIELALARTWGLKRNICCTERPVSGITFNHSDLGDLTKWATSTFSPIMFHVLQRYTQAKSRMNVAYMKLIVSK